MVRQHTVLTDTPVALRPDWLMYHRFFNAAVANRLATALWRHPGSDELYAIASLTSVSELARVDFHHSRAGFVFAPFANDRSAALRIDADLVCTPQGVYLPAPAARHLHQTRDQFAASFESIHVQQPAPGARWHPASPVKRIDHAASQTEFKNLVCSAVDFIRSSGIAKVVVSRTADRPLPVGFDAADAFLELCVRFPQAFVSLVAIPGVGTWLGASPEVLLTVNGASLTTMALAGTQRRPENQLLDEVRWGAKETLEQEMVSIYVRDFFRAAGVSGVRETGPRTIPAGNMVHLQTVFEVDLPEAERYSLANRVLEELHPTSAVCGMPKHKALAFILANEGYDRSFYSGFLGPMHIDGASSLYVNLRCMQLREDVASLYVGAGITAASDPDAEWRETELKAETALSVLHPRS